MCFGEDVSKLRFTRYPGSVVGVSHLVGLGGQNENIVRCGVFLCEFAVLGNLNSYFIVNHKDGWDGWQTLSRFTPLLGAEVDHVV